MANVTNLPGIRRSGVFAALFVTLFGIFLALEIWSFRSGSYSETSLRFAGEAAIIAYGTQQQQREVLPIYPPIPFFLHFVFRNPAVVTAFVSAVVLAYILYTVGMRVQSRSLKVSIWLFLLTSPLLVALGGHSLELHLFLMAFALSNYLLLEFYRRDYAFYLFGFGLMLAFMYFVRAEVVVFSPAVMVGFLLIFGVQRQTVIYLFVALFPLVFAVLMRFFVDAVTLGKVLPLLPGVWSHELHDDALMQLGLVSLPYLLVLVFLFFRGGRYREFYRSPIFLVLLSPFVFLALCTLMGTEIPLLAYSSIYVFNLAILFPYISVILPERKLRVPLSFILLFGVALNVALFVIPDLTITVAGSQVEGNVREYEQVAGAVAEAGTIAIPSAATAVVYFLPSERVKDVAYHEKNTTKTDTVVRLRTPDAPSDELPAEYEERLRTERFVVFVHRNP